MKTTLNYKNGVNVESRQTIVLSIFDSHLTSVIRKRSNEAQGLVVKTEKR